MDPLPSLKSKTPKAKTDKAHRVPFPVPALLPSPRGNPSQELGVTHLHRFTPRLQMHVSLTALDVVQLLKTSQLSHATWFCHFHVMSEMQPCRSRRALPFPLLSTLLGPTSHRVHPIPLYMDFWFPFLLPKISMQVFSLCVSICVYVMVP